ncbi:succinate dehydrogenase hydrophobic membrane anchor protein [alpha proteobacterium U9-1i]|nr:succinate dehydrogenase hydrophobic membrane anchor protein [alpha proteobacterium U9-1i]
MNTSDNSMRTPLGKVRGHGAGHEGTGHFIAQRVSAIALMVLGPWFVISAALTMPGPSYLGAIDFLSEPLNAVGVTLLIVIALYHMRIGMQEVIVDYIAKPFTKTLLLILNTLALLALGAGAVYAVMQVNFGV